MWAVQQNVTQPVVHSPYLSEEEVGHFFAPGGVV